MSFIVVIPARYASQRLPGKPLLDIAGVPMIERVYRQAQLSRAQRVVVATDHPEIQACVEAFGGEVLMTREDHASGTDRLAEVAEALQLEGDAIVVNVQGDEPLIPPEVINQVAENLAAHTEASAATVSEPVRDVATYRNPNAVKVVSDEQGLALYFSRAPMPWHRNALMDKDELVLARWLETGEVQKHIGIYAYRAGLLRRFTTWPEAALERVEKLEQLRILAQGQRIHVSPACKPVPGGVDTQEDLEQVNALLLGGPL